MNIDSNHFAGALYYGCHLMHVCIASNHAQPAEREVFVLCHDLDDQDNFALSPKLVKTSFQENLRGEYGDSPSHKLHIVV